jgi:hypothetical protein
MKNVKAECKMPFFFLIFNFQFFLSKALKVRMDGLEKEKCFSTIVNGLTGAFKAFFSG